MRVSSSHCSRGVSNKPLSLLCHHSLNLGSEVDCFMFIFLWETVFFFNVISSQICQNESTYTNVIVFEERFHVFQTDLKFLV